MAVFLFWYLMPMIVGGVLMLVGMRYDLPQVHFSGSLLVLMAFCGWTITTLHRGDPFGFFDSVMVGLYVTSIRTHPSEL